jgi:hypothetical protein
LTARHADLLQHTAALFQALSSASQSTADHQHLFDEPTPTRRTRHGFGSRRRPQRSSDLDYTQAKYYLQLNILWLQLIL